MSSTVIGAFSGKVGTGFPQKMRQSKESHPLFVVGPGPRAGAEIVDRGRAVLGGLHVDQHRRAGSERLLIGALEFRWVAHRKSLRPERAPKTRPIVIRNAGQFRRQRAVL